MKKKILTLATVITLITGFVSCSNDDFEECLQKSAVISKSVETRSTGTMTEEEVKERLRVLNEKYNCHFVMVKPAELHDEHHFAILENVMRRNVGLEPLPIDVENKSSKMQIIDDSSIDEINIESTVSTLEDGTSDNDVLYTSRGSSFVTVESSDYSLLGTQFYRYNYEIY